MFLAILVFLLKEGKFGSSEADEDEDELESGLLSFLLDAESPLAEEEWSSGLMGLEETPGRTAQEVSKNKELNNKIVLFIYVIVKWCSRRHIYFSWRARGDSNA